MGMFRRAGVLAAVLAAGAAVLGAAALPAAAAGTNPAPGQPEQPPPATASVGGFHVSGNKIIGPAGQPVIFKGVNIGQLAADGTNFGAVVTPSDVGAMRAWGFNLVRLQVDDNLWLDSSCSNGQYQSWVKNLVEEVTAEGMAMELTLLARGESWANYCTTTVDSMADYPDAVNMWSGIAQMFKDNPLVTFEPYNEPCIAASDIYIPPGENEDDVWLDGSNNPPPGYLATAGMQQMYDAIRGTGATNLVFITGETLGPNQGCGGPSTDDSLKVALRDPVQGYNIVYATHFYDGNFGTTCGDEMLPTPPSSVLETEDQAAILPTAAVYPVVIDEFGSACADPSLAEENNADIVNWADRYGLGYAVFGWYATGGFGILVNRSTFGPTVSGIPIYRDLRNSPCEVAALYCPAYVFANPPSPADYAPPLTSVSAPTVSISPTTAAGASGVDYAVDFDTSQEGLLTSGGWVRLQALAGTSFYDTSTPVVVDVSSGHQVQAACCTQVGEEQFQYFEPDVPDGVQLSPAPNIITIPLAGTVSPGDQLEVFLDGVTNPPAGNGSIAVSTSTDRQPATTPAYSITAAHSVSNIGLSLSDYSASATGVTWTTTFTTSATGAMSGLWPGGTITITAPAGTDFSSSPGYASLYDLTTGQSVAGGYLTQSEPAGAPATFTFALGSPIAPGDTLQLVVGNVTNPPSTSYSVSVATSSDTVVASLSLPGTFAGYYQVSPGRYCPLGTALGTPGHGGSPGASSGGSGGVGGAGGAPGCASNGGNGGDGGSGAASAEAGAGGSGGNGGCPPSTLDQMYAGAYPCDGSGSNGGNGGNGGDAATAENGGNGGAGGDGGDATDAKGGNGGSGGNATSTSPGAAGQPGGDGGGSSGTTSGVKGSNGADG